MYTKGKRFEGECFHGLHSVGIFSCEMWPCSLAVYICCVMNDYIIIHVDCMSLLEHSYLISIYIVVHCTYIRESVIIKKLFLLEVLIVRGTGCSLQLLCCSLRRGFKNRLWAQYLALSPRNDSCLRCPEGWQPRRRRFS